ncbi:MAG: hypothetical protein RTU63_12930 [Candidatus Thorarchaeota archaeon]
MSTTKNAGKVAVGMFLILSIVVFGSLLYVGFCCVNTDTGVLDTGVDDDGGALEASREPEERIRRGDIEYVPTEYSVESIRRGDIEYVPEWMPRESLTTNY